MYIDNMGLLSERARFAGNPLLEEDAVAEKLMKSGKRVVKLNIGDPAHYFPTPRYTIDAFVKALREGRTGYSEPAGINSLKKAVVERYGERYGLQLDDGSIIATAGVSEALQFINSALINRGDAAILFKPYYSLYLPQLRLAGGFPIFEDYDEEDNWNIGESSNV